MQFAKDIYEANIYWVHNIAYVLVIIAKLEFLFSTAMPACKFTKILNSVTACFLQGGFEAIHCSSKCLCDGQEVVYVMGRGVKT